MTVRHKLFNVAPRNHNRFKNDSEAKTFMLHHEGIRQGTLRPIQFSYDSGKNFIFDF